VGQTTSTVDREFRDLSDSDTEPGVYRMIRLETEETRVVAPAVIALETSIPFFS